MKTSELTGAALDWVEGYDECWEGNGKATLIAAMILGGLK